MEPLFTRLGLFGFRWSRRALGHPAPITVVARLAERYDFQAEDCGWTGYIEGLPVHLHGDDGLVTVRFELPERQAKNVAIIVDRTQPVPPWPSAPEDLVITGDARFDADAHVIGPGVEALVRLDRITRDSLRAWPGLTLYRGEVAVPVPSRQLADQFMGTLRALRHTVARLCVPASEARALLEARFDDGREPPAHQQLVLQHMARSGWLDDRLIRRLLSHPRPEVRLEAATLAPNDDPAAADALWAMLSNRTISPSWRAEAVHRWMARAPAERRRTGLADLAEGQFPEVTAACCFWWAQQPDAREKLGGWLRHPTPDVRAAAMVALGTTTNVLRPREEAIIIRALHAYPDPAVARAALQALRVGGTRSLKAVRDYLDSSRPSPEARRAARATLKELQIRRRVLPGRLAIVDEPGEGHLSLPGGQAA